MKTTRLRRSRNFLVLGGARCGTTLLMDHLNCHELVRGHGEILSEDQPEYGKPFAMNREQLKVHVQSYFTPTVGILTGAKILTYQLNELPIKMTDLVEMLDRPMVVALYRRHTLEQYVSLMMAKGNGIWHIRKPFENEPIRLDPDTYVKWVDREHQMWRGSLSALDDDQVHYLSYEALIADLEHELHGIFDFLGLEHRSTSSPLLKLNPQPLAEKLINCDEFTRSDVLDRMWMDLPVNAALPSSNSVFAFSSRPSTTLCTA